MEAFTVEELALQRIFDLKNEVVFEFESHQRLFDEALLSNVFLKGFDPPPWLSISGKTGEIPILPSRRPHYSVFRTGSGGERVHRQDSVNNIREQERFSELYGGFFCKRKKASSSVDRPSCPEVVAAKKPRVEESGFVAAREIDGDQSKGLVKDTQEEEKGKKHGFGDVQHGENEKRQHLVDVEHGRNEGEQGLFDAQLGRKEETSGSQVEDVQVVEKEGKNRPRRRGANQEKNDAVSPFVGRITRSRAKQCQVLLSAKKDISKRRCAARSKQPRGTRRNASAKGASGLEVSEEPKDAMELWSSAAAAKPKIGGKSSPLMTAFGIEDQLSESSMMIKSQIRNKSSPVVAESLVEVKLSPAMTQLQNEDRSSPVMNNSQIEDNGQRVDTGCTEGTVKNSEMKYASLDPRSGGSEDIDHNNVQEEDTSENVERCTGGEPVPKGDCLRTADSCDAEQLEASNLTDTAQKQEIPSAIENVQQHEISDMTGTQLKLREEHPVDFQNQLKDNFCPVEEGAKGEVPSVLRPFENRKSMDTMPIDTTLVSNATCTPPEMGTSRCNEIVSGKVYLLDDNLKSTPPLVQGIPSKPRYSSKSVLSDAPRPSKRSYVFERSVFSDKGNHPISVNVNLLGNGLVQDVSHSPIEVIGHKLSLKANARDMTAMDVPLRNEREDTDAIGISLGEIPICPDEKIPDQDEPNTALYEERDKYEKVNHYLNLGFIHNRTTSFDSALGLSCHNLHKSESDIAQDLTNKFRNRSVDCCKKVSGKETNSCSNIVANIGGQDCLKRFWTLSGSSVKLPSQSNEGQDLKRGRSPSPVDVNAKIPSGGKENRVSQMPEDTELMFTTENVDEPFFYPQKSWEFQGKVVAYDSALAISSLDEAAKRKIETSCNVPSKKLVDVDTDFMDRTPLSSGMLFSRNMVEMKEVGGMNLQHNSWPNYQKQSGQVQQQFCSASQPRLWQTKSCSKILDDDTSIRLSNCGIEVTSNDAGLISQCDGVAKPCTSDSKIPSGVKKNRVSQVPEDTELMFMTENVEEPFFYSQKSWESQGKVGSYDSALAISSPDEASKRQIETSCNASSKKLVDLDTDFMDRTPLSSGKLFSRNMVEVKEVGGMKLQHNSWPNYQKRSGQVQQQFRSASQPRLWQTESCSKILDGDTSIRLSNGGIEVTSNESGLISQCHGVAKPCTSDSKGNCDMENSEQRHDTPKYFSCEGSNSSEAFPDQQNASFLSSQTRKDVKQSLGYSEHQQKAKLILEECSTRMGLYPRLSLTDLAVVKCGIGNENVRRSSPSCISYSTTNEGAFGCTGLSQVRVDSMCFQATRNNTSAACLQGQPHLHAASLKSCSFRSSFEVTSPPNLTTEGDYRLLPAGLITPAPNHISKYRTLMPLDARWSHNTGLQEHKECSEYAMNDSYMAAHGLPTDKFQSRSGFSGVVEYGTKIKNSPSLTPAGRTFFERIGKNFMDKDSNFSKQIQMIKEHAGCFPIDEESGVEEESMDHPISMKQFENRFGSSAKKSILGAKKVLMDSSLAKQNSPVTTPAGGKFFERISTNSTDTGSNLLSNKASMNRDYTYCFNNEEEIGFAKENIDPSVPGSEFRKKYGSSVKKNVLGNHNTQAYSSNTSQISPTKSNQKSNNLLSNVRSFIPLVQQKPTAASIMTGKRDIKVKSLEAAEAAKQMEEKREQERKMRKELARRGEQEKNFKEKPKEERYRGEREGEETSRATSDCSNKSISNGVVRKKPVGGAFPKSHTENSSQLDTFAYGVDSKLRRALEAKNKLEQDKLRKLEEEQRRKEEERKKKEAELAAKKRKREDIERKDREEKRKRLEEVQRQQKEMEEQLRAGKEVKEQRRRALDEYERKRKAMEEEAKKQRRIEKEKEAAERRRQLEEDAKASKFVLKDAKHLEETYQQHEATLQAHKANAGKVSSMCNNFAKNRQPETEVQSMPGISLKLLQSTEPDTNILSYEISPYKGSDEEDNDEDAVPGKFIPLWARKENLIQHLTSQQYIDPDEIFTGAKTCSLNEVFGTNGSLRRIDFHRRSKSGEWLSDKFTWKEEYQYKLQMGYINKG